MTHSRGPFTVYANEAPINLVKAGWDVARLDEGVAEWRQAGYTLAQPSSFGSEEK